MTIDAKLKERILKARQLDAQIEGLKSQLSIVNAEICEYAAKRTDEQTATENGGCIWQMRGLIKITWPAPSIKSFPADDPKHDEAKALAGEHYKALFETVRMVQPVKAFRPIARGILPKADADKLIALVADEEGMRPRIKYG